MSGSCWLGLDWRWKRCKSVPNTSRNEYEKQDVRVDCRCIQQRKWRIVWLPMPDSRTQGQQQIQAGGRSKEKSAVSPDPPHRRGGGRCTSTRGDDDESRDRRWSEGLHAHCATKRRKGLRTEAGVGTDPRKKRQQDRPGKVGHAHPQQQRRLEAQIIVVAGWRVVVAHDVNICLPRLARRRQLRLARQDDGLVSTGFLAALRSEHPRWSWFDVKAALRCNQSTARGIRSSHFAMKRCSQGLPAL
jgi:hypothetical protein